VSSRLLPPNHSQQPGHPIDHFGRFLAETDTQLVTLAELDRQRHIEPFLTALTQTPNRKRDGLRSPADRARRVLAISSVGRVHPRLIVAGMSDEWKWGRRDGRRRRAGSSRGGARGAHCFDLSEGR